MRTLALRLHPGQDLNRSLEALAAQHRLEAACILTCIGSLQQARIRLANRSESSEYVDKFEILSLGGTLSRHGSHLHIALADGQGQCLGGHLLDGCLIYTTAELVLGVLDQYSFTRPLDPETGYDELLITPNQNDTGGY